MKKETFIKYGKYLLNSLLGIGIYFFFGIIFNGNHSYVFPATFVSFFLLSYYFSKKNISVYRDISIIFLFFIGTLLTLIFASRIASVPSTVIYLIMMPISVFMGSWARKQKLQFVYFAVLLAFVSVLVRPNLIHYFRNIDAFQNKKIPELAFYSLENEPIQFEDKVIVIDLWSTSCGVCFRKFPIFEKLKQDFETNDNIQFFSANVPLPNDTRDKTLKTIKQLNYDYETIFAEKFETIRDSLGINGFPYLLIVKNDTIKYLGDMETEKKIVLTNTKNVIHQILEE